jgi:PAS domain S-box-containing protein
MADGGSRHSPLHSDLLLDAVARALVVTDRQSRILAWNARAEAVFGWSAAEAIGTEWCELVVPAFRRVEATRRLEEVTAGTSWEGDVSLLTRRGEVVRIFAAVTPLRDEAGDVAGVVLAAEDVSDLRLLERRAAQLAEHLQVALDAGRLGTWTWNMATGETTWDPTLERLFGLPAGSFDGTYEGWISRLHPDDRPRVLGIVEDAIARKARYEMDHRVRWPDGSIHWLEGRGTVTLDEHGEVTGTIGCVADITERKLGELGAEHRAEGLADQARRDRLQRERLEFLVGLTDAALGAGNHHEFMAAVAYAAVPQLGDWCAVHFRPDPNSPPLVAVGHVDPAKVAWAQELNRRYPYHPDAPTGVAAVMRTGQAEFVPVVDQDTLDAAGSRSRIDAEDFREAVAFLDLTSVITVPLTTSRGVIGAVQLISAESRRTYDHSDLALANAAAGRIAATLENMWLSEQQRRIASILQEALLPPLMPVIPGVELAARYWAAGASDVGGDFYDVFAVDPSQWAIVIGDVCGKGPDAAALTGIARHTIRAAAKHGQNHAEVLDWLNDAIRNSNRNLFCTACYATLAHDGTRWQLASTAGGHPLPIVVRADGSVEHVGDFGTLIGALDTIQNSVGRVALDPGDTVVFHTDGATDVPPPHALTEEELAAIVADAARARSAQGVADRIYHRVAERLPIAQRKDDIALVILRIGDPPADE